MRLAILSFSYKRGLPQQADYVFDARFLQNPHYVPELNPLSGCDAEVGEYIMADPAFAPFFGCLCDMLDLLIPRYRERQREQLTIAIGCTGGKHRSVFVAEKLASLIVEQGRPVELTHRDLELA